MDLQDTLILAGTLLVALGAALVTGALVGIQAGVGVGLAVAGAVALWLGTRGVFGMQRGDG